MTSTWSGREGLNFVKIHDWLRKMQMRERGRQKFKNILQMSYMSPTSTVIVNVSCEIAAVARLLFGCDAAAF